jgi:DNA-binding LacI/PurR family transcriptional regulator
VEEVGRIAGQAFIDHGHRDIMYCGIYRYRITRSHECGLREVLKKNGLSLPENRVLYGPQSDQVAGDVEKEKAIRNVLSQEDHPTAVFCSDDTEAERVYWIAMQVGLKVPDDISIIGFGDIHHDTIFRKQLTSVVVDELELGRCAARLLCEMCVGDKAIECDDTSYMPLQLFKGNTLAQKNLG